jgi:hypothetical protein
MFNVGQVAAVKAAFSLAGYDGDLRSVEQVLTQLLGRKVWVLHDIGNETVPFS